MDAKEITVYKCSKCGQAYTTKEWADKCCEPKPKKVCENCGCELDEKCHFTVCGPCREKRRYNRCAKMTLKEYYEVYPDGMLVYNDNYFSDYEDLEDYCTYNECDVPKYAYGTSKCYSEIDIDCAIENAEENAYEDAEFDSTALKELHDFIDKWNEKHKLSYFEEANIVVLLESAEDGDEKVQ